MFDRLRTALERRLEKLLAASSSGETSDSDSAGVEALRAKGNELLAAGDFVGAESWFRQSLKTSPDNPATLVCLGFSLKEQARLAEARIALRRAITASADAPDMYEARYLLGQISEQEGDLPDARKHYTVALEQKPDFSRACEDLCRILTMQGQQQAVRNVLEQCVARSPETTDYRIWLAETCAQDLDFENVAIHLQVAIALGINTVDARMHLGAALCRLGRVTEAIQIMAIAQAMDPAVDYQAHYHIGYYHIRNGELKQGLEHMERAITLRPDFLIGHSSILMALSHAGNGDSAVSYRSAAERFATAARAQVLQPVARRQTEQTGITRAISTKLRVGFVSADLYQHSVASFLEDVLRHLNRTQLQLVAYSNNPLNDEVTESLKSLFDEWHVIRFLTDAAAAELIASHHIDVLLDLGGHTGENRLAVFTHRPAPIQATWLGYFASTGLQQMDYIIGDPVSTPTNSTEWFSEKVYRMPQTRLCMSVPRPQSAITILPPPSLQNGYITFGSYQQVTKITPKVLALWSRVMQSVPQSRLRIQTAAISIPSMRERLLSNLLQAGITPSRVTLLGTGKLDQYLESHNEIDILLDTFPYPGGTTTAYALWMGVPTVTLAGDTMLSLQGAGMLQCVDLKDWIAQSETEYVDLAIRMASTPQTLAALRSRLRDKTLRSPLFDSEKFAKDLEAALFHMSRTARAA